MANFFIDAGHGGQEFGGVGNGLVEKYLNLTVSLEVQRIMQLNKQTVHMTRISDITVPLNDRAKKANTLHVDYFVSIHHNCFDRQRSGTEVYCSIHGGKGKELAEFVGNSFRESGRNVKVLQIESKNNPGNDFYGVIRNTNMPAIIIEAGYIDSPDYINFDTIEELHQEARTIAEGLLRYIGISDIVYDSIEKKEHWAKGHFDYHNAKNITLHEQRFDDKITRGETFSITAQLLARIVELEKKLGGR
jgi:N-acetylmuramoyl-L-alanine amidase